VTSPFGDLNHLSELQRRGWRYALSFCSLFGILFYYANTLYTWLAQPLLHQLPEGSQLVATQITAPFLIPMKCALICAFLGTLPQLIWEIWGFIKTGLYPSERHRVWPLGLATLILFYTGVLFAYTIICPTALRFFIQTRPESIQFMIDIGHYVDFIVSICFYTGLAFETPLITFAVITLGWLSLAQLSYFRKYVIVAAFVLGMLLTPPDVVSQILLALPIWGLFELGLLAARWQRRQQRQRQRFNAKDHI